MKILGLELCEDDRRGLFMRYWTANVMSYLPVDAQLSWLTYRMFTPEYGVLFVSEYLPGIRDDFHDCLPDRPTLRPWL